MAQLEFFDFALTIQVSDQPVEPSSGSTASTGTFSPWATWAMTSQVVPMTESPVENAWTSLR